MKRPARPHVLMSADAVGGVWTYALDLAEAFVASGVEITLAVFGPADGDKLACVRETSGLRIVDTRAPLDWLASSPGEARGAAEVMANLCAELKPDLAHLNSPSLAADRLGFPTIGVCHSCLETWWRAVRSGPAPGDFAWRTGLLRAGLRNCDVLIAPSVAFAEATAAAHGISCPTVVRNGRRPRVGMPAPHTSSFAFTAARLWDEGKNIATLDAAAGLSGVDVFAAGPLDGPQGQRVRLAHARPLGSMPRAEVAGWLARRPIFVSSAVYEPFGLAALEAAQAGCALLLSDIATHRELWRDAAWLFNPRDPNALAAGLRRLVDDPAASAALGARALARSQEYAVDAMAGGTLRAYATVAPAFAGLVRQAA